MNYVTNDEADTYFGNKFNATLWDDCSEDDKTKLLYEATQRIDRLKYRKKKTTFEQPLEFPRGGDLEVPNDIKVACCEIAYQILDGRDIDLEVEDGRIVSESYSGVRVNNNPDFVLDHIHAGIPSYLAWTYLLKYLVDPKTTTLTRVT